MSMVVDVLETGERAIRLPCIAKALSINWSPEARTAFKEVIDIGYIPGYGHKVSYVRESCLEDFFEAAKAVLPKRVDHGDFCTAVTNAFLQEEPEQEQDQDPLWSSMMAMVLKVPRSERSNTARRVIALAKAAAETDNLADLTEEQEATALLTLAMMET